MASEKIHYRENTPKRETLSVATSTLCRKSWVNAQWITAEPERLTCPRCIAKHETLKESA